MLVVQKQEQKAMRDVLYLRLCLRAFSQAEVDFSISAFRKIRNRTPKPQPLFRPSLDVTTYGLVEVHLHPRRYLAFDATNGADVMHADIKGGKSRER